MKRSPASDAIVCKWEGYHKARPDGSCEAYADPAHGWNVPTIGYGTTRYASAGWEKFGRREVRQGDVLTRDEALSELDAELDQCEATLARRITAPVTQAMFDAMCSFAFNIGLAGAKSQIDRINARKYEECAASFDLYVKANGRVYQGLVNRRNDEEALFRSQGLEPDADTPSEPKPPSGKGRPYAPAAVPLDLGGTLRYGSKSEGVYVLQCALIGLGLLRRPNDGELLGDYFNGIVLGAVMKFQREVMHEEGDGIVGPLTKAALEKALTLARTPIPATENEPILDATVARLRPAGGVYASGQWTGLKCLLLKIGDEMFEVASGARGRQQFRRPKDPRSVPGNLEPLPQGRYRIGDIAWAGRKDNYEGTHGAGLGPVWVPLDAEFSDDRGAFGFHLDANIGVAPGSAGCVVFRDVDDLKRFVAAFRRYRPETLSVEWGLGQA